MCQAVQRLMWLTSRRAMSASRSSATRRLAAIWSTGRIGRLAAMVSCAPCWRGSNDEVALRRLRLSELEPLQL